jgi:hypothetical protein
MARNCFFSFHYANDFERVAQVRNMGVIDGNPPLSDSDWEAVTKGGDEAVQGWIDSQMTGRACAVVLVGTATAGRKWITYEVQKAWNLGMGLLGIRIHALENLAGETSGQGGNPFDGLSVNGIALSSIAPLHFPTTANGQTIYDNIRSNLDSWVEQAIAIRHRY